MEMAENTTLETVSDYISDARVLLQDTISPYRYDDTSLLTSINVTLLETRRIRPDIFVYRHHDCVPSFSEVDDTELCVEPQFRLAILYGLCAHALTRDQEDVQDNRAIMFRGIFNEILLGLRQRTAGIPPVAQPQKGSSA